MNFSQFIRVIPVCLSSLLALILAPISLVAQTQAPFFYGSSTIHFSAGVPNVATISAAGFPEPAFSALPGLPGWAHLDPLTGVLSGTPPADITAASWNVTILASSTSGVASRTFSLNVRGPVQAVTSFSSRIEVSGTGTEIVFGITGGSRKILLRSVGPGLAPFGVTGYLVDPQLHLTDANSGTLLRQNDNWDSSDMAAMAQSGAFALSSGSADSAIVATLAPGMYRAKFTGVGGTNGVALMEFYDVSAEGEIGCLTYLSIEGPAGSWGSEMVVGMGFAKATDSVLMRALGPGIGTASAIGDPAFDVYNGSNYVSGNDDWSGLVSDFYRIGAKPLTAGSKDSAAFVSNISPGLYTAKIRNQAGAGGGGSRVRFEIFPNANSDILRPPLIDIGEPTRAFTAGTTNVLSVGVHGTRPFTVQWFKDNVAATDVHGLSSDGTSSWIFPATTSSTAGVYTLAVTGPGGTYTSAPVTVSVVTSTAPLIVSEPQSTQVNVGNMVGFHPTYTGTAPLSYQWRKNGVPIPGATSASLVFQASSVYDAGAYDVVVTNLAGSATSRRATLAMGQMPSFASPLSHHVRMGDPVKLAAHSASNVFATYAWLKHGGLLDRSFPIYNLEGQLMEEIASGQAVPAGRWTTPNGGALYLAGMGSSHAGQIVGGNSGTSYEMGVVRATDLGSYSVDVTINSAPERRGPAAVALRGTGALGRRFVAVNGAGQILTSTDGLTWATRDVGPRDLSGVAVKGDVAVAVGRLGVVQRSTDLETWTPSTNGIGGVELNSVVAGPDRFVAVGESGRVFVSADGLDWYHARIATTTSLRGVTYGNGVYVMTGANGAIFASVDGFNWVNRNSQTTSEILFVTFSGTQFWALTTNNQLITSPDGLTWSRTDTPQPAWFRSLAYNGAVLIAVGMEGRVYTSADGAAWTLRSSGTLGNIRAITWSGFEVPSGFNPAAILSDLDFRILNQPHAATATLGQPVTFSVTATGAPTSYQWYKGTTRIDGATGASYTIPSVQAGDVGGYSVTVTSTAGQLTSSTAGLQLRGGGTLGSQFIAVGDNGVILTSPDGLQFIDRTSRSSQIFRAVAASAFGAVAVGRANSVATSSDGINWSYRNLSLPGDQRILRGIAAGPSQFVAVGSAGTIIVSFDSGDTWKLVSSGTTQGLWGVAWNGSRFVAVGEGGIVLASFDGLTWTAGTSPTSQRLYGIHADGAKLIAVTELGAAYETSNGGSSWSSVGVSGDLWARGVAVASGGRRVIVGDRGLISTSAGGSIWNLAASPTTSRLYGVTWTGALGVVSGDLSTAIQAPTLRILSQPQAVAGFVGGTASLSVTAGGVGPYEYQWLKNGVELSQQTQSTLFLANLQPADAGSYSVEVRNAHGVVSSTSAALTVSVGSGSAPTLASSPASRSVSVGSATNFVVAAEGSAPFTYRWYFNGNPISGAVSTTLALSNVQMANAGSYTVMVSNRYGSVTSAPAALTVTSVPGMPVISQQPASQAVAANGVAVFTVVATGTPTPTYQWRKDGNNIDGATQATYTVDPVGTGHAGVYTVRVSNTVGEVISEPASLTVVPAGTTATHRQTAGRGYEAGGTVTITSTLTFVGQAQSAGWEVLLPAGWLYVAGGGAQGDIRPAAGETQLLSWAWTTPPSSPITFTYTLQVPAGTVGAQAIAAMAVLRQGGVPIRLMAQPDPLIIAPSSTLHAADTSGDQRIDLFELTRVIELYNTRNGSVRTGAYRVDSAGEDGFAGDSTRSANSPATLARYHSADTRTSSAAAVPDGAIDLFELTRVIELYNQRAGSVRTGQYRVQAGTEDGFAPGP